MPPVRHLKSDQRHEIEERNSDDAAYQPRQHADRPIRGLYRWQWTVPAPRVRLILAIMFRGR
jgi:hypothetical protein